MTTKFVRQLTNGESISVIEGVKLPPLQKLK